MPALDALCRSGRITGYTMERDPRYLGARRPTLSYRMYRDAAGLHHARRFAAEMRRLRARTAVAATAGNRRLGPVLERTAQLTMTATFGDQRALARALTVVRHRYYAAGARPEAGSWWLPDVRLTGCHELPGTVPALTHSLPTAEGLAVALTTESRPLLRRSRLTQVQVLEEWLALRYRRSAA